MGELRLNGPDAVVREADQALQRVVTCPQLGSYFPWLDFSSTP